MFVSCSFFSVNLSCYLLLLLLLLLLHFIYFTVRSSYLTCHRIDEWLMFPLLVIFFKLFKEIQIYLFLMDSFEQHKRTLIVYPFLVSHKCSRCS